jgi:peptidoglycan/LPS O-acetylase OafA/YrhL
MPNRIDALTSTRGFAAILVVIFHFGKYIFPFYHDWAFFGIGNVAVNYFFVLSGFVMTLVYRNLSLSYGEFIKRRFARIAPVYYLALLLAVIPALYFHYFKHALRLEENFYLKFILSALFLQAYIPGYALVLNRVAWTISVEFLFYFLFPFLLVLWRKPRIFIWITIVLFIISQGVQIFLSNTQNEGYRQLSEFFFFNPVLHLNEFLIGMTGCYFYFLLKDKAYLKTKFLSPGLLIIIVVLIHLLSSYTGILNGLLDPLFMLLIIAVATENPRLLNFTPLVFIGEISYGIYILQKPVHYYIADQFNVKYLHLTETPLFYLYLVGLLVISSLSYYIIERPLRKKINSIRIFSKKPEPDLG